MAQTGYIPAICFPKRDDYVNANGTANADFPINWTQSKYNTIIEELSKTDGSMLSIVKLLANNYQDYQIQLVEFAAKFEVINNKVRCTIDGSDVYSWRVGYDYNPDTYPTTTEKAEPSKWTLTPGDYLNYLFYLLIPSKIQVIDRSDPQRQTQFFLCQLPNEIETIGTSFFINSPLCGVTLGSWKPLIADEGEDAIYNWKNIVTHQTYKEKPNSDDKLVLDVGKDSGEITINNTSTFKYPGFTNGFDLLKCALQRINLCYLESDQAKNALENISFCADSSRVKDYLKRLQFNTIKLDSPNLVKIEQLAFAYTSGLGSGYRSIILGSDEIGAKKLSIGLNAFNLGQGNSSPPVRSEYTSNVRTFFFPESSNTMLDILPEYYKQRHVKLITLNRNIVEIKAPNSAGPYSNQSGAFAGHINCQFLEFNAHLNHNLIGANGVFANLGGVITNNIDINLKEQESVTRMPIYYKDEKPWHTTDDPSSGVWGKIVFLDEYYRTNPGVEITIGEWVTYLPDYLFAGDRSTNNKGTSKYRPIIRAVNVRGGVTPDLEIGKYCFHGQLSRPVLPFTSFHGERARIIRSSAFDSCEDLNKVIGAPDPIYLAHNAFTKTSLGIRSEPHTISGGGSAEYTVSYLPWTANYPTDWGGFGVRKKWWLMHIDSKSSETIDLTETIFTEDIGKDSLYGICSYVDASGRLRGITIPESVKVICNNAFCDCSALEQVRYQAINASIYNYPEKANVTGYNKDIYIYNDIFGASDESMGNSSFVSCKVIIGKNVEQIPERLFRPRNKAKFAFKIKAIEFEDPLATEPSLVIGGFAFSKLQHLTHCWLPKRLKYLNSYVFSGSGTEPNEADKTTSTTKKYPPGIGFVLGCQCERFNATDFNDCYIYHPNKSDAYEKIKTVVTYEYEGIIDDTETVHSYCTYAPGLRLELDSNGAISNATTITKYALVGLGIQKTDKLEEKAINNIVVDEISLPDSVELVATTITGACARVYDPTFISCTQLPASDTAFTKLDLPFIGFKRDYRSTDSTQYEHFGKYDTRYTLHGIWGERKIVNLIVRGSPSSYVELDAGQSPVLGFGAISDLYGVTKSITIEKASACAQKCIVFGFNWRGESGKTYPDYRCKNDYPTSLETLVLPFIGNKPRADSGLHRHLGYLFGKYTDITKENIDTYPEIYSEIDNCPYLTTASGTYYFYIPSTLKTLKVLQTIALPRQGLCGCRDLTNLVIECPTTIEHFTVGEKLCKDCSGLKTATFNKTVKEDETKSETFLELEQEIFLNCIGLESFPTFDETFNTIRLPQRMFQKAFSETSEINAELPLGCYEIAHECFKESQAKKLTLVWRTPVGEDLTLKHSAFRACKSEWINIKTQSWNSETQVWSDDSTVPLWIESFICAECENLREIPTWFEQSAEKTAGVCAIPPYTFYKAFTKREQITSLLIPDNINFLDTGCFASCSTISNLCLRFNPESSKARRIGVGDFVFANCTSLTDVWLEDSDLGGLCTGAKGSGTGLFAGCKALTRIPTILFTKSLPVDETASEDYAYLKSSSLTRLPALCFYKAFDADNNSGLNYALPQTLTFLGDGCFAEAGIKKLNLTFPALKVKLGSACFAHSKLESCGIIHPTDSDTSNFDLGQGCFRGCTRLTTITALPKEISTLTSLTFLGTKISEITSPDIIEIEDSAFGWSQMSKLDLTGCNKLRKIHAGAFVGCSKMSMLRLPVALRILGSPAVSQINQSSLQKVVQDYITLTSSKSDGLPEELKTALQSDVKSDKFLESFTEPTCGLRWLELPKDLGPHSKEQYEIPVDLLTNCPNCSRVLYASSLYRLSLSTPNSEVPETNIELAENTESTEKLYIVVADLVNKDSTGTIALEHVTAWFNLMPTNTVLVLPDTIRNSTKRKLLAKDKFPRRIYFSNVLINCTQDRNATFEYIYNRK